MAQTKLLVPLDGSELAESALSEALSLAKVLNAEVILLQAVPAAENVIRVGGTTISIDEQWQARKDRAVQYLDSICNRPEWRQVSMRIEVEMGHPADTILDYSAQHGVERIVMATHGRTGMSRWVLGSIAEKVLHAADRTVVLVRAGNGESRWRHMR
jgi:nucleotide-binding universal stress UspA family protein